MLPCWSKSSLKTKKKKALTQLQLRELAFQGHFTLQALVEWTKDFSNVIGGEQKFIHLAFGAKAKG
jgi:hypothetical protein